MRLLIRNCLILFLLNNIFYEKITAYWFYFFLILIIKLKVLSNAFTSVRTIASVFK